MKRRNELTQPRRRGRFDVSYDPEAFGRFSESIARYLGTARFLVWQTIVIVVWLGFNILPPEPWQFDPWDRGLVLLTLVLSLQASYAAPLILLAQARQERRDRIADEYDREVAERTQADTEFLAREIAGVRLALADVVTGEEMHDQLSELTKLVEQLSARLDDLGPHDDGGSDDHDDGGSDGGADGDGSLVDPIGDRSSDGLSSAAEPR